MSFNIVDLVKDQVKGQLIGHMGNLLGNEGGKATAAVDSMIPALLNGITGTAASDEGSNKLFGAIQDQDDSLLDNMGALLGGGQASTVIDNGNSVLTNLFGDGGLGKLAGALSGFSGVSKGGTSSLIGMLAPVILGILKRKVMGDGLNAGGLASMLSSQSSNISASLPQGLTDQLNSSGFLSGLGGIGGAGAGIAAGAAGAATAGVSSITSGARGAADSASGAFSNATDGVANAAGNVRDGVAGAAGDARDGVANAAGNARDGIAGAAGDVRDGVAGAAGNARDGVANAAGNARDGVSSVTGNAADTLDHGAKKGGGFLKWLAPLAILGALAWAAFTFLMPGAKDATTGLTDQVSEGAAAVTDTATDAAATATDAVKDTAAGMTDGVVDPSAVGDEVGSLFSSATDTLGSITDADSAKAAIPAFGELGTKVDSVSDMFGSLPEAARGPVSAIANTGLGTLEPMVEKVMALPGVGSILSPVIGPIMEKLQGLGG